MVKPAVANTASIRPLSGMTSAISLASRLALYREGLQQQGADADALVGVVDEQRHLGLVPAGEPLIAR